jgi:flavin-dependent dehydrogenase
MKIDFDIIVIGAGLVGLTTALACAHKGASVCLLDAANPDKAGIGVTFCHL